jgi:hypothetical protein
MDHSESKIGNDSSGFSEKGDSQLYKYLHDIKNFKILNKTELNNIMNMSCQDKMKIICAYNDMIEHTVEIINSLPN